jgi:hypothetical protein
MTCLKHGSSINLALDERTEFREFLYPEVDNTEGTKDILVEGIINTLRQRKATRPHDKAYAMYGVLQTMGLQLAKLDYSKSIAQTYHELMVDLLCWSPPALLLLLDAGNGPCQRATDTPTWVADWSQRPPYPTISDDYFL